jgi:serine/threonine-protein kinase
MATVHLARAHGAGGFEREVALKLVHSHLRETSGFAFDLVEEARLAARIRHPNVVPILDAAEEGDEVFLAMEYIEGDSLIGLLRRGEVERAPIPLPVRLRILVDALHGLHAAHELRDEEGRLVNLVHRDFSPQNILVGLDGIARLTDFGIAKASTRIGQTTTGLVKGKIRYMSPEQARGQPLDRRCDVWAAGVIAWELLAGRRLFTGDNDVAIALAIVSGRPARLAEAAPSLPVELDAVVARALCAELDERTPTALDFAQELGEAARALGGLAELPEVAAVVKALVGPRMEQRRAEVTRLIAERSRAPTSSSAQRSASLPPLAVAEPATTSALADSAEPKSIAAEATVIEGARPAGRSRRAWVLWAAGVGILGVAGLAVASGFRALAAHPLAEDNVHEAATVRPTIASSPVEVSAPPPISSAASGPLLAVELRADAPIGRVRIGERLVTVAPAASVVLIPLRAVERAGKTDLSVIAADGRRAAAALAPDSTSIDVSFPKRAPVKGVAVPTRGGAGSPEPLATSPYPTP